jgi:LAS superfamily LD-carboxypeptidase LdcB
MKDNPYPTPPIRTLIQMLRIHAWADHIDDDSRILHEQSADALEHMANRLERQALHLERAEAAR